MNRRPLGFYGRQSTRSSSWVDDSGFTRKRRKGFTINDYWDSLRVRTTNRPRAERTPAARVARGGSASRSRSEGVPRSLAAAATQSMWATAGWSITVLCCTAVGAATIPQQVVPAAWHQPRFAIGGYFPEFIGGPGHNFAA